MAYDTRSRGRSTLSECGASPWVRVQGVTRCVLVCVGVCVGVCAVGAVVVGCSSEEPTKDPPRLEYPAPVDPPRVEPDPPAEEASAVPQALLGEWTLVALEGLEVGALDGIDPDEPFGAAPTMLVEASGQTSGSGGVNRWSGSFAIDDAATGAGRFTPIITTMMAGPPEAMERESKFLRGLGETSGFDPALLAEGFLVFRLASGQEVLRFARLP